MGVLIDFNINVYNIDLKVKFYILKLNILDFELATADEVCLTLGGRLKAARLAQGLLQADLAARAGVSRGTVVALENTGRSTLQSLIRIVQTLGLVDQLSGLFQLKVSSIAEMAHQAAAPRRRASRKSSKAPV